MLLNVTDAARIVGVSTGTLYRAVSHGRCPAAVHGPRPRRGGPPSLLFDVAKLRTWVNERQERRARLEQRRRAALALLRSSPALSNAEIAERTGVATQSVWEWRLRIARSSR